MEPYEFFDHTADAEFQSNGKTLEEAFSNSAQALISCMFDDKSLTSDQTRKIAVQGSDQKSLLYSFLEEILYLIDTEGFITKRAEGISIQEGSLQATLLGCLMSDQMKTHGEVKAITYHSMEIGKEKGIYFVRVVVDM